MHIKFKKIEKVIKFRRMCIWTVWRCMTGPKTLGVEAGGSLSLRVLVYTGNPDQPGYIGGTNFKKRNSCDVCICFYERSGNLIQLFQFSNARSKIKV